MYRSTDGFTLIELLVVLAIMAIVAGLIMPALSQARQDADTANCQSSLRQWAAALHMYVSDSGGYLPRRGQGVQVTALVNRPEDWFNALPPKMGMSAYSDLAAQGRIPRPPGSGLWLCPRAVDTGGQYFFGYGMNMRLSTWMNGLPGRLSSIANASAQVFMADGLGSYCSVLPSSKPYSPNPRHAGYVNISFVDGHVASFSGAYVGCGAGDPNRPDVQWIVPSDPWPGPGN